MRQNLVPEKKIRKGETVAIRCAHGNTLWYPLAEVEIKIGGQELKVEAAVSDTLPMSVLLGTDVPALTELLGGRRLRNWKGPRGRAKAPIQTVQKPRTTVNVEEGRAIQGLRRAIADLEDEKESLKSQLKAASEAKVELEKVKSTNQEELKGLRSTNVHFSEMVSQLEASLSGASLLKFLNEEKVQNTKTADVVQSPRKVQLAPP